MNRVNALMLFGLLTLARCAPPPGPAALVCPTVPASPAEQTSLPPVSGTPLLWQPGHWDWVGQSFAWTPGRWIDRADHGALWQPGYFDESTGACVWRPGHFAS